MHSIRSRAGSTWQRAESLLGKPGHGDACHLQRVTSGTHGQICKAVAYWIDSGTSDFNAALSDLLHQSRASVLSASKPPNKPGLNTSKDSMLFKWEHYFPMKVSIRQGNAWVPLEPAFVKWIQLDTVSQTAANTEVSGDTSLYTFTDYQRPRQTWDTAWHSDNYRFDTWYKWH